MTDVMRYVKIERTADETIVHVAENYNPDQFAEIVNQVYELARADSANVRLDLGCVEYIPSTSLGALVALDKRIDGLGGKLILAQPSDSLRELLQITRLDTVLTLEPS